MTRATSRRSSEVVPLFASSDAETPGNYRSVAIEGSPQRDPAGSFVADHAARMHPDAAQLLPTVLESSWQIDKPSPKWIYLDLPEIGACGPAEVLAIESCPQIEPGLGQVVTGTFAHSAANVIDLAVEGLADPIGCTANHPFWSEDRQNFVPAQALRSGEDLRTESGTLLQVTRITPRRGPPVIVCNLEVDAEHVYYVSAVGILVHNSCLNRGGSYDDLNEMKEVGEVPHHMPQNAARTVPRGRGPALGMSIEDHQLTRTFAGRGARTNAVDRLLSPLERLRLDIHDIRTLFGDKYNEGIEEMLQYAMTLPEFHSQ